MRFEVLDARDETFQSGHVGMWTKADSVIEFDDFTVAPPAQPRRSTKL